MQFTRANLVSRFGRALLAAVLLAVQAAAATHELEHALHEHDDPACALHLYCGNTSNVATSDADVARNIACDQPPLSSLPRFSFSDRIADYRARAPPIISSRSFV